MSKLVQRLQRPSVPYCLLFVSCQSEWLAEAVARRRSRAPSVCCVLGHLHRLDIVWWLYTAAFTSSAWQATAGQAGPSLPGEITGVRRVRESLGIRKKH